MARITRPKAPKRGVENPYRPLASTITDADRHNRCVDHVRVEGLSDPVCILSGDDPEAVVAEARQLSGR